MAKDEAGEPWRKRPSTILWTLSLGQLVSWGLVYYPFPLFVAPMTAELGWSRSALFGALSSGLLVAGLCSIPVGAWIDRGHGRMLMTGGSLLAALLLALWSKVDSLLLFYALWIALGACQSVLLYEPAFAVITRVYGPRYREAIVFMTFVGGLASTVGIPLTQFLIGHIGWRPTLEVLAAVNLGVGLLLHWPFIPGPQEKPLAIAAASRPVAGGPRQNPLAAAVRLPAFWGLVVFAILYGVANGLLTILRGMAVPAFIGPEGYGVVTGALTMPTNVMRAAGPILASLAWGIFGGYTPVLWGLAAIMLVAAAGFAAAALLSKPRVAG